MSGIDYRSEDTHEGWRIREARQYEKGLKKIDIQEQFREMNQGLLKGYGRDRFTYKAELTDASHQYWNEFEGRLAHGYPATAWLQLALLYGVGAYTAQEQGCVPRGTIFCRFWRFHYFDWITFLRRGGMYAWAGGLVAGTVLFGSPDISVKRCVNFYNTWMAEDIKDVRNTTKRFLPGKI